MWREFDFGAPAEAEAAIRRHLGGVISALEGQHGSTAEEEAR